MNEMIERAVKALEIAQGNAPFYVMPSPSMKKISVMQMTDAWQHDRCEGTFKTQNEAEDLCEKLNNQWIVKKVIESLKGEVPYYESPKHWSELTSKEVWNLCLDKILSGE